MSEPTSDPELLLQKALEELAKYKKYYMAAVLFGFKDPKGFQKLCRKLIEREGGDPKKYEARPQLKVLDALGMPVPK